MIRKIARLMERRITEDTRRKVRAEMVSVGGKVLDLGCGDRGSFDYFNRKIVSADRSKEVLEKIKSKKKIFADADKKLPFKRSEFDMVVLSGVIQYLKNPEAAIREMKRVLKGRGMLVLTTVNRDSLLRMVGIIKRSPKRNAGEHNIFSKRQIIGLLSKNGFRVKKVTGADFAFMPKNLSSNLIFVAVKSR